MRDLRAWLNNVNRTADKGVELYNKYGTNPNVKHFLSIARSRNAPKVVGTLLTELRQILDRYELEHPKKKKKKAVAKKVAVNKPVEKSIVKNKVTEKPVVKKAESFKEVNRKKLEEKIRAEIEAENNIPKELINIYERRKRLYVEARNLHARMAESGKKNDREKMAGHLLNLWDDIGEAWGIIDHHKKHGKMPEPEQEMKKPKIKCDISDTVALIKRRGTVRTYVSRAKNDTDKAKKYQAELDAIEKILSKG